MSPRWGLDLGGPDVSINIPPRWGCLWYIQVYFSVSCVFVKNFQKNQDCLKTGREPDGDCPNYSNVSLKKSIRSRNRCKLVKKGALLVI